MANQIATYSVLGTWAIATVAISLSIWSFTLDDAPRGIGFILGGTIAVWYSIRQRRKVLNSRENSIPSWAHVRRIAEKSKFVPDLTAPRDEPLIGVVRSEHDYGSYLFLLRGSKAMPYWVGISREFDRPASKSYASLEDVQHDIDRMKVVWIPDGKLHRNIQRSHFAKFRFQLFFKRIFGH